MKLLITGLISISSILFFNNTAKDEIVSLEAASKKNDSPTCYMENNTFQNGERMTFKVYYNWTALWLNAGEVVFKVQEKNLNDKPVYHVVANGQTYKSYEWFYKVKDQYETYVDVQTLQPYKFVRDVDEGGYIIKNIYDFDYEKNKVYTQDLVMDPVKKETFDIPNCVHDVLSAIYFARNIDFDQYKPDDKIPLSIFIDGEVYDMYIRYLGKEEIKTKLGKFRTIKFKPLMLENEYFDGGEKMVVWVSDDKNKMPVRIETPIKVGSIKADLMSFSGAKYPFTAQIK